LLTTLKSRLPDDSIAAVAAGTTVVLWASAFVGIRGAAPYFSPGALAFGRLLAASVVLLVVLAIRRPGLPARRAWPGIIGSGVLWFGVYMVTLNWGEQSVDAGTAAMIVNIGPIVIALLGGWLLGEGFPPRLLAGMAVAFAGTMVIGWATSTGAGASPSGVMLCVVAALGYGAGMISQKVALRHASSVQVTVYGCLIGALATTPFAGQFAGQAVTAPTWAVVNVVYLGVFPTALAFSTWAFALSRTSAGRLGATTYLVPAIVILLAWGLLDELPSWLALLGGVLCLGGVAVTRSRSRSTAPGGGSVTPDKGAVESAGTTTGRDVRS